ncbi:MAG: RNA methyltransferase [Candidatus Falkowbacteria bacterium]
MRITSAQNPKIKEVIKLRKAGKRREEDLIIVEGKKETEMALAAGLKPEAFFFCPEYGMPPVFPAGIELFETTPEIFKKISLRENPDGWLMLARPGYLKLGEVRLSGNPLVIILETVEKPGNLGAILRTADAAGADAVIVTDPKTDIYNPNVIRASRGTVFAVQTAVSSANEVMHWLRKNKINILAAAPETDMFYTEPDYRGPTAIVIGAEHEGLSETWFKAADKKIKIPMKGKIDSLNASVSAAIIVYEAVRQREKK